MMLQRLTLGALTCAALALPAVARADVMPCSEIRSASEQLEPYEEALDAGALSRKQARTLRRQAVDLEEIGSLMAGDDRASDEQRELGEQLASAALQMDRALAEDEAPATASALQRVVSCLDELSDVCFLSTENE